MKRFRTGLVLIGAAVLLVGARPALAGEYTVSKTIVGEGATVDIADTGAFDVRVDVKDGDLPSPIGEPKLGQAFAFAGKQFALAPGTYSAQIKLTGVNATATRTGGGAASSNLGAALDCDACRVLNTANVRIVASYPTMDSLRNADVSVILRFEVPAPTTVGIRGIVDAGASTGGQLFANPQNPDLSVHWGQSVVSVTGTVSSIVVNAVEA